MVEQREFETRAGRVVRPFPCCLLRHVCGWGGGGGGGGGGGARRDSPPWRTGALRPLPSAAPARGWAAARARWPTCGCGGRMAGGLDVCCLRRLPLLLLLLASISSSFSSRVGSKKETKDVRFLSFSFCLSFFRSFFFSFVSFFFFFFWFQSWLGTLRAFNRVHH